MTAPMTGEALHRDPFCRCGHKKNLHAGAGATGRCVKRSCGCGRYELPGDDFVQDRHADLDAGENGGAMTDADFYDRTEGAGQ